MSALDNLKLKHAAYVAESRLPNPTTAQELYNRRHAREEWHEAQRAARHEFAQINGWKISKSHFAAATLRDGKTSGKADYWGYDHNLFDHPECYRLNRYAVCIVAHVYGDIQRLWGGAALCGLDLHIHPDADASWYYPGGTRVVAYTRPGVEVIWPRRGAP